MPMRKAEECIPLSSKNWLWSRLPSQQNVLLRAFPERAAKHDGIQCYKVAIVDIVQQPNR